MKAGVVYLAADRERSETREALALAAALCADAVTTYVLAEEAGELPALGELEVGQVAALSSLDSEGLYQALRKLLGEEVPEVVVVAEGRLLGETASRLAGALGYEAVLDAVRVRREGESLMVVREVFGGKALVHLRGRTKRLVLAAKAGSQGEVEVEVRAPSRVRQLAVTESVLLERRWRAGQVSGLKEARVVVSGGRGVGSAEAFRELEVLARHVGGAVGASRAAVDQGWARPEQQVGLTGTKVAPEVYVAIGISGASQHLAGMASSRVILAVNADEKAPIVEACDVAFLGDWQAIWPHVKARIQGG